MAVPTTNVGLSDIAAEFGGTTPHALSEYYGDGSAPASGTIRFSHLAGESAGLTLKTHGVVINSNTNATSYSGSLSASVAAGDVIVIARVTGYGDYDFGSTTIQGLSPTTRVAQRTWSSPTYGQFKIQHVTATSAASSISVSCPNEGSTNRQGMYVYAWLIGGGAQYEDNAGRGASQGNITVDTGEDGAIIVGSAYAWSAYAMPNLNGVDYETTLNRDYHVWYGHAVQSGTAATYTVYVATQGSYNAIASFTKA